jgi:Ca-activated chloride channel family protein
LFLSSLAAHAQQNDLLMILDASGSMWGQVEGENKIVIARRVLGQLAAQLPDQSNVGLIAYGHRREADCADIETLLPIGPLDRAALTGRVNEINPKGHTPITNSIQQALATVRERGKQTTIVLLSDGIETCSGDPCATVRTAKQAGDNFLLHVIGFDLAAENVAALECSAQAGGGLYFDAKNAADLATALEQATAPEELGDASLSVRAVRNGALTDVAVTVKNAAGEQIAGGRTYANAQTNPRVLPLPAGKYMVTATAVGLSGSAAQTFEVEIPAGGTVERVADFSSGEIAVGVIRNGALSDATVKVLQAGTQTQVAASRTYTAASSNPKIFEITPGSYDIEIASVEVANKATGLHRFENVEVKPSERLTLTHEFASGVLSVGVVNGAALIDAVISVRAAGQTREVAGGRSYTAAATNPKKFELTPGNYTVIVTPVRMTGNPKREFTIEVVAGQTAERKVDFAQ